MEITSSAVSPIDDLSDGWELIRPQYGNFFAMSVIIIAISIGIQFALSLVNNVITAVLVAIVGNDTAHSGISSPIYLIQGFSYLSGTALGIFSNVVNFCLVSGFFVAIARLRTEGTTSVGDMFKGFALWKPCAAYAFVMTAAQFVMMIVFGGIAVGVLASTIGLDMLAEPDRILRTPEIFAPAFGGLAIVVVIMFLVFIFWSVLQVMVLPLIARGEDFSSAFFGSIRAGLSNFVGLLVFSIVCGLLMLLGVVACVVGVLFVIPVVYAGTFIVGEKIFGPIATKPLEDPPSPDQFGFSGGSTGF